MSKISNIDTYFQAVEKIENEKLQFFESNATFIGKHFVNDYPRFKYLYYAPLSKSGFASLSDHIKIGSFPEFEAFLSKANGARLNNDALRIFGWPDGVKQGGQAIGLQYGNIYEVPKSKPSDVLIIGGFDISHSEVGYLYLSEDGKVGKTRTLEFEPIVVEIPFYEGLLHFSTTTVLKA